MTVCRTWEKLPALRSEANAEVPKTCIVSKFLQGAPISSDLANTANANG